MPGLSVFCSDGPLTETLSKNIKEANILLSSYKGYKSVSLINNNNIDAHFAAYPDYPRTVINNDNYYIFIEGVIYNKSIDELTSELPNLAIKVFNQYVASKENEIYKWITRTHGDYIILLFDKKANNIIVFNDPLGRLPLFYYSSADKLLIAREPKYIVRALNYKEIDSVGIAEYLIFGYNFSCRTSLKNIFRLQPASMISYNYLTKSKSINAIYSWEFGLTQDYSTGVKILGEKMAELFMVSLNHCLTSTTNYYPLAGFSGGLDSRAVYFGLLKLKASFSSYTALNTFKSNLADVNVAQDIVNSVPSNWRLYKSGQITLDDYKEVAYNQEVGSYILMAIGCCDYRNIKNDFNNTVALYTGDGGGQLMHPMTLVRTPKSIDELVKYTCHTTNIFSIDDISSLLQLKKAAVYDSIYEVYSSYPESQTLWKYAHFKMLGRGRNLIMDGEDRTRFKLWLVAPFWNSSLLEASMTVPEKHKHNLAFYKEFLRVIDNRALDFIYANTGYKIGSLSSNIKCYLKGFAKSQKWLYHPARKLVLKDNYKRITNPVLDEYMIKIINHSQLIEHIFEKKELKKLLASNINKIQYHTIHTILLRSFLIENDYKYID